VEKIIDLRKGEETAASGVGADVAAEKAGASFLRSRRLRFSLAAIVILVVGLLATRWLSERWSHVYTDDSRIAATLVTVSSEVSGRVTSLPIVAGETVRKGQLLASIDDAEARLELQALDSQIAALSAQQSQLRAQQDMVRAQIGAKTQAGESQIKAAEASHAASEAALSNARGHFQRVSSLAKSNVMTENDLENARAALATAEQQERVAAAAIVTATANLAVTRSDQAQIAVLDRQIATLEAQKEGIVAKRKEQSVDLSHRQIRADFEGIIDATFINPGEYVSPGIRMFIYHDPEVIWVDANIKETSFGHVKVGAPVTVTVDAYPDLNFRGKVARIGGAANSEFALLPSPNPSGNFTKITQRLPIRVSIKQHAGLLRPGMMVEINIDDVD